jgi:tryptophan-rich sensory protein
MKLVICLAAPLLVGVVGAAFTRESVQTWYPTLQKPWFTPPGWVFGPAWTVLYVLMGVAAFLVWRAGWERRAVRVALGCFLAQLVLNGLWSPAFFGLRSPLAGWVVLVLLVPAILATVLEFRRVSTAAAWLLIPYLLWTGFATVLNASILILNL